MPLQLQFRWGLAIKGNSKQSEMVTTEGGGPLEETTFSGCRGGVEVEE